MKKLYYVKTLGYDMVVSVDQDNECRYMTENKYFPILLEEPDEQHRQVVDFLESIEDDSSWECDCEYDQIFTDEVKVMAEIECPFD